MSDLSAKSFIGLLRKSKLLEADVLKETLDSLFKRSDGAPIKLDQITQHLLSQQMISEWHLKKLLSGKYKGFFLGKYKLLRHLGTGGMSTVYLAQHTLFNQERAIKVLPRDRVADKTYLDRFYREGRAVAALNHKNIVRVYDISNEGDTHYLVMEYVKGEDIYEKVKRDGPVDFLTAIDYTVQTMTGLQHAHDNDLVHRDVKPANLLVTPEGEIKILDLGLALFQQEETSLTVMHNERVLGTADYLSPEQAVDSHSVDHRSDIYSAGCTLYFMLTGKPPFHEGTLAQRIAKHQSVEPQDVRDYRADCPGDLLAIVHKMMRKKADERFQDCKETANSLRMVGELLRDGTPKVKVDAVARQKTKRQIEQPTKAPTKQPPAKPASSSKASKPTKSAQPKTNPVDDRQEKPASKQAVGQRSPKAAGTKPTPTTKPAKAAVQKQSKATLSKPAKAKPNPPKKPAKQPVNSSNNKDASKRAARKVESQIPKTEKQRESKSRPEMNAVKVQLEKKARVDASEVAIDTQIESASEVGVNEFRKFVSDNRVKRKTSSVPKRKNPKEQWLMVGFVLGMMALLGLFMAAAMFFLAADSKDDEDQEGRLNVPSNMALPLASGTDQPRPILHAQATSPFVHGLRNVNGLRNHANVTSPMVACRI